MDKKALNPEGLNNVSGGVMRTVDTKMALDAVVRGGPGMQYPQVGSFTNGTQVNTTGNYSYNSMDGRTWYEINYPMYGWMAGSLLGYYDSECCAFLIVCGQNGCAACPHHGIAE